MHHLITTKSPIILASKSPRRRELLQGIFHDLLVVPSSFDESSIQVSNPGEYVKELSLCKASSVAKIYSNNWVIGADTIVEIDNEIIGKPHNKSEAIVMLRRLSGVIHRVYTGYTILCKNEGSVVTKSVSTNVEFKVLSTEEIKYYVSTGEPFGKSGGYAIQGIGSFIVKKIYGSYTSVMGLPICEVMEDLIVMNVVKMKT